jgi:hypothetical protein
MGRDYTDGYLQYCDKLCNKDGKSAIFRFLSTNFKLTESWVATLTGETLED